MRLTTLCSLVGLIASFSVLSVAAFERNERIGCYSDNVDSRLLDGDKEIIMENTPEACVAHCESQDYNYAGVEGGQFCYCGSSYGVDNPLADSDCEYGCPTNPTKFCGGELTMIIYATGKNLPPCSHQQKNCARFATCTNLDSNNIYKCECINGTKGDGLKGLNNTGCEFDGFPCSLSNECYPEKGECINNLCQCMEGFEGDGKTVCDDIDECEKYGPCDVNADCQNIPGGYTCSCHIEYTGNGKQCNRQCQNHLDCHNDASCDEFVCKCREGFSGNGFDDCYDINECAVNLQLCDQPNMKCINLQGSYECQCDDRYYYDEKNKICQGYLRTCQEYIDHYPNSRSGLYELDLSGPSQAKKAVEVYCIMDGEKKIGITVVEVESKKSIRNWRDKNVVYTMPYEDAEKIVDHSKFCYQMMKFYCKRSTKIELTWEGKDGINYTHIGPAEGDHMCPCGHLGVCKDNTSNCNCNGVERRLVDGGKTFTGIPVRMLYFQPGIRFFTLYVGALLCGDQVFDIPLDCHDARLNYNQKDSRPTVIDPDDNELLPPFLVECDMHSEPRAGVTVISHDSVYTEFDKSTEIILNYKSSLDQINKVIERSFFCTQHVEIHCQNLPMFSGSSGANVTWTSGDGTERQYWGGALGKYRSCACGVTRSCADPNANCNCDSADGVMRTDFGPIIDKRHLPIVKVTVRNADGADVTGTIKVGPLRCSQRQIDLYRNCADLMRMEGETRNSSYVIDPDTFRGPNAPLTVQCEFSSTTHHAKTIFNPIVPELLVPAGENMAWKVDYWGASHRQIAYLATKRSTYCEQKFDYGCPDLKAVVHPSGGGQDFYWLNNIGEPRYYLSGVEGDSCKCGNDGDCLGGRKCNCDLFPGKKIDNGILRNKTDFPLTWIMSLPSAGTKYVQIGSLECQDIYPTCHDLYLEQKK